ncbi:DoxX family protein [Aureimonas sp. Leaf460]|nr:DoxX family protein [Aureimonas sp. Leaf460]KQT52336.1 DoxX family protein [Aureimonas sp. Leaf427]KQT61835.1 DoxX family protein [Aureimonas sp. Leaf460]
MRSASTPARKGRTIASWTLRALLGAVFLAAGGAKIAGLPMMVEIFDQIGLGQGFRSVTGLVEVVGAIGLFVPGMTLAAALWLGATMAGGILTHLLVLPTSPVPAIILFGLCAGLAWLHRDQALALKNRLA